MKHIIGAFSVLMILLLHIFIGVAVITVNAEVAAVKEYKAAVVAEVENSNFNPAVIAECKAQAAKRGYSLQVTECLYDEERDLRTAEVVLTYTYKIPLLGITNTRTTRGIAR